MRPGGGLLVTGTDTGVGKTLVGAALAAALAKRFTVGVLKPAETGCRRGEDGSLVPDDATRLRNASGCGADLETICPFRYEEPLAPWVAAERSGRAISIERIRECFDCLASAAEVVLVESAGGLLVPLRRDYAFADLAADLGLRLLVVVGTRLGAINQALLTLECAKGRGLEVAGYVLNQLTPEEDLAQQTNAGALERLTNVPCLARIPYLRDLEPLHAIGDRLATLLLP